MSPFEQHLLKMLSQVHPGQFQNLLQSYRHINVEPSTSQTDIELPPYHYHKSELITPPESPVMATPLTTPYSPDHATPLIYPSSEPTQPHNFTLNELRPMMTYGPQVYATPHPANRTEPTHHPANTANSLTAYPTPHPANRTEPTPHPANRTEPTPHPANRAEPTPHPAAVRTEPPSVRYLALLQERYSSIGSIQPPPPPSYESRQAPLPVYEPRIRRQKRTKFTPTQLSILETEFSQSKFCVGKRLQGLAQHIGVSAETVKFWFQNKRQTLKRKERMTC